MSLYEVASRVETLVLQINALYPTASPHYRDEWIMRYKDNVPVEIQDALANNNLDALERLEDQLMKVHQMLLADKHSRSGRPELSPERSSSSRITRGRFDDVTSSNLSSTSEMMLTPGPRPPSIIAGGTLSSLSSVGATSLLSPEERKMELDSPPAILFPKVGSSPASFAMNSSPQRASHVPLPHDFPLEHVGVDDLGTESPEFMTAKYKPHYRSKEFMENVKDKSVFDMMDKIYRNKLGAVAYSGYSDYSDTWPSTPSKAFAVLLGMYNALRKGHTTEYNWDVFRGALAIIMHEIDALVYRLRKAKYQVKKNNSVKTTKRAVARAKAESNESTIKQLKRKLAACLKDQPSNARTSASPRTKWKRVYRRVKRRYT